MSEVEHFIYELNGAQREIMMLLHKLLSEEFGLQDKIRYRVPFYYGRSWICYLNPIKKESVELAFLRANELSNDLNLLDFKDRKQVAGITYSTAQEVNFDLLRVVLLEAIALDETKPYASKRKK